MAYAITIVGTETFTMTTAAADAVVTNWIPESADQGADEGYSTIQLEITDTNIANLEEAISRLHRILQQARDYYQGNGVTAVYLNVKLDGTNTWRTLVHGGRLDYEGEPLKSDFANLRRLVSLSIARDPFFEGAEATIPLTNTNGTDVTTGINVYNCNDGSGSSPNDRVNYIQINDEDVLGDLPTPAIITITDTDTNDLIDDIYIGHDFTNIQHTHWVEAETGSSDTASATSSGGYYHNFTTNIEKDYSASLTQAAGRFFRILARVKGTGSITAKPYVKFGGVTYYGRAVKITLLTAGTTWYLYDFGIVQIPYPIFASGKSYLNFYIGIVWDTGVVLGIDYLQVTPLDSYMHIIGNSVGGYLQQNYFAVLDGVQGINYFSDATKLRFIPAVYGGLIMLRPNTDQRLYFLTQDSIAGTIIDTLKTVIVSYRPRRRTV